MPGLGARIRWAHLEDFLCVVLKHVEWLLQIPHVMQSHLYAPLNASKADTT